jgi:hypothetical protein
VSQLQKEDHSSPSVTDVLQYFNLITGEWHYAIEIYNECIRINTNLDVRRFNARSSVLSNCIVIFDAEVTECIRPLSVYNTKFISLHEGEKRQLLVKTRLMLLRQSFYAGGEMNCIRPLDKRSAPSYDFVDYEFCYCIPEFHTRLRELRCTKSNNNVGVFYRDKATRFSKHQFVVGVEIELPKRSSKIKRYDKRLWYLDNDVSQIKGDTELITKPLSLAFVRGDRFKKHIHKLYADVEPPTEHNLYTSETAPKGNGSGVHVHVSWHKSLGLESRSLRMYYYNLLEELGGEEFVIGFGGKPKPQLDKYSGYRRGERYDCFNCIGHNHIELRWLATDPDPDVVHKRIRVALDIFQKAVLEYYGTQIKETICLLKKPNFSLLYLKTMNHL